MKSKFASTRVRSLPVSQCSTARIADDVKPVRASCGTAFDDANRTVKVRQSRPNNLRRSKRVNLRDQRVHAHERAPKSNEHVMALAVSALDLAIFLPSSGSGYLSKPGSILLSGIAKERVRGLRTPAGANKAVGSSGFGSRCYSSLAPCAHREPTGWLTAIKIGNSGECLTGVRDPLQPAAPVSLGCGYHA